MPSLSLPVTESWRGQRGGHTRAEEATMPEVTHQCPPTGGSVMPCCGKTPFEVSQWDRITLDPELVTCRPDARSLTRVSVWCRHGVCHPADPAGSYRDPRVRPAPLGPAPDRLAAMSVLRSMGLLLEKGGLMALRRYVSCRDYRRAMRAAQRTKRPPRRHWALRRGVTSRLVGVD